MDSIRRLFCLLIAILCVGLAAAANDAGSSSALLDGLKWREIGPAAFGGRISDVEAVAGDPNTIFVAAASGGVFKTTNNGVSWQAVFDRYGTTLSIGDLAIAPSDSNVVWAGSGEPNNRQSSPFGDGVYRSLDAGLTWKHMGLADTHHIGRVVIHPDNPDVVYVAALGHLWGPNEERGLYRTRDGGRTWEKVLSINADTGVVDVAIEAGGRILYAAAYQRRRRAWGFVGGGPHSGLYRSLDGGANWEKLANGLPSGDTGRIGISIARSRPNTVFAIVENKEGGVFRSQDRGASWERVNELNPRPMYYSQIRVDPGNPDKVWVLGSPLFVSIDGGKNFTSEGTAERIHVDHHALWIDPNDSDRLILGNDGGLYFSYDSARHWDFIDNLPIAQYYAIGIDRRDPYWVYGGTQDNGSWAIPSRTDSELGITNRHVANIAYGDGFYSAVDPRDYGRVYTESQRGRLYSVDLETREERGIRPVPQDGEEKYRFNWSSPFLISRHDPDVLYFGGNKLFRSSDRGGSWQEISPDLTFDQDWEKLPIIGVERSKETLSLNDGTGGYGTLTTIGESPLQADLIYVGSDDGKVQMSSNGGGSWLDLTDRFDLPGYRWVSRVLPSRHSADTAYVSFDGHRDDDFRPYVFKTTDGSRSWSTVSGNLPQNAVINSLAEAVSNPDLLWAGTEIGLYVTFDGGRNWGRMKGGLPPVPVDDIIVNDRDGDLILGTHGRGIWILDDIAALERSTKEILDSALHLYPIRRATQIYQKRLLPRPGAATYWAPNPSPGALISYYLKDDLPTSEEEGDEQDEPKVRIAILDARGREVREIEGPGRKGLHRIAWDLRGQLSFEAGDDDSGWFGPPAGPWAMPGSYTVRLDAGGQQASQVVQVRSDPRRDASEKDLLARFEASTKVNDLLGVFSKGAQAVEEIGKRLDEIRKANEKSELPEQLGERLKKVSKSHEKMKEAFRSGWRSNKHYLLDLLGQLQASTSAPTESHMRDLDHLRAGLEKNVEELNTLSQKEFPEMVKQLGGRGAKSSLARLEMP